MKNSPFLPLLVAVLAAFGPLSAPAAVRISEIGSAVTDPWGNDTSFVELHNAGDAAVDLAGWTIKRYQKGKYNKDNVSITFPDYSLAAGACVVVWCSDDFGYASGVAATESANVFVSGNMKFKASNTPRIDLFDSADASAPADSFQVLAALADGQSMEPAADPATDANNYYFYNPTPGAANNYETAVAVGPTFVSESHPAGEAPLDRDLPVSCTWAPLDGSTIASVRMVWRLNFGAEYAAVEMTPDPEDPATFTAAIPAEEFANYGVPGSMVRWRFEATDSEGRVSVAPAFGAADSSPRYFGTITASGVESALPVFHLFVADSGFVAGTASVDEPDDPTDSPLNLGGMDVDYDALANNGTYKSLYPLGVRCSVYHAGRFYDNVRIDLRGNTSATFEKHAHGLKFNKSDKLLAYDPTTGRTNEVRKTSFTAEFVDPSFLRQYASFAFLNAVGTPAPLHHPVRVQLNGAFYQLAFHSMRFSDELLDYYADSFPDYGFDADACELIKNAGTFLKTTSASGFETKIPEYENEQTAPPHFNALMADLKASDKSVRAYDTLNLPLWINYMAAVRVTQEMDDVWSNLSAYYDDATATWWPLAYDMNLSFGQFYCEAGWEDRTGESTSDDALKSHPLYGGSQVRVYNKGTTTIATPGGNPNYNGGFDAIYADETMRGMHLRRLRTLMDGWLKAPGTPKEDTPLWRLFADRVSEMSATAALDRDKWTRRTSGNALKINVWGNDYPATFEAGVERIWTHYIVPRREHLYVTHSATNSTYDAASVFTGIEGGAFVSHNAGIPEPQPAGLSVRISRRVFDEAGTNTYVKVDNPNDIFLDVSGWTLSTPESSFTVFPGTVIPPGGSLYIVADRAAFVAAHPRSRVLIEGNLRKKALGIVTDDAPLTMTDTAGFAAGTRGRTHHPARRHAPRRLRVPFPLIAISTEEGFPP